MDFETYPQSGSASGQFPGDSLIEPMERSDKLRPDWLLRPKVERISSSTPGFNAIMAAHQAAVEAGQDGYIDPESGLFVMTAQSLNDRGWCCDCGCRHCPYV